MRLLILLVLALILAGPAHAGCELAGPRDNCRTDGRGNTWRTEENLGGGYTTRRNGDFESTTNQNLNGGFDTRNSGGGLINRQDNDPYGLRRRGY